MAGGAAGGRVRGDLFRPGWAGRGVRHRRDRGCRCWQDHAGPVGHPVAVVSGAMGGGYGVGAQHPAGGVRRFRGFGDPADPMAFLAAAREAILAQGHCVIGVDDAHLLDPLSATLLHRLAMEGSVRIVATVRSGRRCPMRSPRCGRTAIWTGCIWLPFSKDQCVGLIEQALGGRVEGLSADLMWQASGGNALFVRHLVEGAVEAGTLRQVRGVWQLRGRTAVTSELAALLDARIEQLPDDVVHALQLLTFCEPLELDTLTRIGRRGCGGARRETRADPRRCRAARAGGAVHPSAVWGGDPSPVGVGGGAAGCAASWCGHCAGSRFAGPAQRIRLAELTLDSDEKPRPICWWPPRRMRSR